MKYSIVIPAYNEEILIKSTVNRLLDFFSDAEIVISDDGSSDGTETIARSFSDQRVVYVRNEINRGKGSAVKNGVRAASGDIIIYTDCDLAYGLEQMRDIMLFHEKNKNDVTIGSRALHENGYKGYSVPRKIMSKLFIKIVNRYSGCRISDSQAGIKCFDNKVAKDLFSLVMTDDFSFDIEMIMIAKKKGYVIAEFPVEVIYKDLRKSKVSPVKDAVKMLKNIKRIKKRNI